MTVSNDTPQRVTLIAVDIAKNYHDVLIQPPPPGNRVVEGGRLMRFAGIDVGAERHMAAMVDEQGEVLCRSSPFGEDASGYARLFELPGPPEGCLLALEATGHYWRNLFVALLAKGYAVAVLNPLRARRFADWRSRGATPT
jgi:hypothetical protein